MFTDPASGSHPPDVLACAATRAALVLLLGNLCCSEVLGRSKWDLACDLPRLRGLGVTDEMLVALVDGGYVEKRHDGARDGQAAVEAPHFCFALTQAGAALARRKAGEGPGYGGADPAKEVEEEQGQGERPVWKPAVRELWFGGRVVKKFRRAAPNQESVLAAFQELGWPERIDDPMPREPGVPAEERLRETVKTLNRGLARHTVMFRAEADGRGAYWAVCPG